jgi:hypothetical protein|tara:strand:- start:2417 stop:2776 length:360 start_codon:yes stop_codon:yes gene_type:complete
MSNKNSFGVEMKTKNGLESADLNGDGHVTDEEIDRQRKILEIQDEDAMRDAQRKMAWFALWGMLLYPFAVVLAVLLGLSEAAKILGSMASVYFVSVAAIVAAFFGGNAYAKGKTPPVKK